MQELKNNFPELKIEFIDDGNGTGSILLKQNNCGHTESVAIHPIHLRYMAEKISLIQKSDPIAQKTIATLTRQLLALRERVDHLANWLANHSDHKHADLSYEMTYATATADIAEEFCFDLSEPRATSIHGEQKKPTESTASPQAPLL